jgi:hypothetical protein
VRAMLKESILESRLSKSRMGQSMVCAAYTSLYTVLTLLFGSLSYGEINLRVANVMVGAIPIIGWSAVIGQTLGVLVTGTVSPLGPIDLVNVLPAFFFSWMIWKLKSVSVFVGLLVYSVGLGLSVSLTIWFASRVSLTLLVPYVTIGIFVMTTLGGYSFYNGLKRAGISKRL